MKNKKCNVCGLEKSELQFSKRMNGDLYNYCRSCHSEKTKKWNDKNREYKKEKDREYTKAKGEERRWKHIQHKYGITKEQYFELFNKQNGKCTICGTNHSRTKMSNYLLVDHCHKTKKVRGLLCNYCNTFVGLLENNPTMLIGAVKYLEI